LKQVKEKSRRVEERESISMDISKLEDKLKLLREQLSKLETEGMEKIRQKRILADMGDDFRENEGAKLVMEDNEFLHMRITDLKREIGETKKRIIKLRG
jgi:predicted RNase H-like nuclease (RuvC/YqgF family)